MLDKKNGDGASRPQDQQVAVAGSVVEAVYHHLPEKANAAESPCRSMRWSELHEVQYPAKLVMSRWDGRGGKPFACADTKLLWSDVDVARRIGVYEQLEASGMIPYWWLVVEADRAGAVVEDLLAQLEDECEYYVALLERQAVQLGVA